MPRQSMSGGGDGGSKRASEEALEEPAAFDEKTVAMVAGAVERLSTVPLKIAAVLYAVTGGKPMVSVAREDLLAPLTAIGCDNATNATQANRLMNYQTAHWFAHNGERGMKAGISLTKDGSDAVTDLFTDITELEELTALCHAINNGDLGIEPDAPPLSQRKQARGTGGFGGVPPAKKAPAAAPAATGEVEVQVEARIDDDDGYGEDDGEDSENDEPVSVDETGAVAETEDPGGAVADTEEEDDEDDDAIPKLQQRVDRLARLFDERIQKGALATAYGELAAAFLKNHNRVPTSKESDKLVRDARAEMYTGIELGDGKVKRQEISDMFLKLQEATKLAGEVLALEERASTMAK